MTVAETAGATGAAERSIYRWRRDSEFRRAVGERAAELLDDQRAAVGALWTAAISVVRAKLASGDADGAALAVRLLTGGAHLAAFAAGAEAGTTRHEHRGAPTVAAALASLDLGALSDAEIGRLRACIETLEGL